MLKSPVVVFESTSPVRRRVSRDNSASPPLPPHLPGVFQCWGRNNNGQLGQGDNVDRGDTADSLGANLAAIEFGDSDVPTAIDCGSFFTCALMDDSSIKVNYAMSSRRRGLSCDHGPS